MPSISYFLFCSDACTFQYEIRDVHAPVLGAQANKLCFFIAYSNVESCCAFFSRRCRHPAPLYVHQATNVRTPYAFIDQYVKPGDALAPVREMGLA